ncbi:catechol 1,2-dioxygenase [Sulfitobacter sp. F26204]|uniref:dioxygenase family protein n=1 Tax=Sulfitobacter sp. F26204 TaxID=2996014 RepID=UPI00225E15A1|nr:dioxygenase [Sulfitobacter sp. F26204]MCX7560997.1 catechol 1,2-dioxygenase [Sulfitobacter sp. F26204]
MDKQELQDPALTNLIISREDQVTPKVLNAMAQTDDARLREIMASLVRHIHAFIRETRPTEKEFETGLQWITRLGQSTNESHNETVLAADVLGISTLIDLINNDGMQGETMSALLGPFYRGESPVCKLGETIARSVTRGAEFFIKGRVTGLDGKPVEGATLDIWQASPDGLYENQDPDQDDFNLRGVQLTGADGCYEFHSVRPKGYPVPTFGPAGELLKAQNRIPMRPAHVHFIVSAPGHKTLITQIFTDDEQSMAMDVVFGAKRQICGELVEHTKPHADYPKAQVPFYTCEYDFVLKPGTPTFPVPPITGKTKAAHNG